jgi:hypothetical protein
MPPRIVISELEIRSGANNEFVDCVFVGYLTANVMQIFIPQLQGDRTQAWLKPSRHDPGFKQHAAKTRSQLHGEVEAEPVEIGSMIPQTIQQGTHGLPPG